MTSSNLMSTLLVFILVLLAVVHTTTAQNYHFSNGWYAGKKRSSPSYASHIVGDSSSEGGMRGPRTADEACNIRPEAVLLINRIIQEEVARIQKVCTAEPPSGLREILENAATRLDSESKW